MTDYSSNLNIELVLQLYQHMQRKQGSQSLEKDSQISDNVEQSLEIINGDSADLSADTKSQNQEPQPIAEHENVSTEVNLSQRSLEAKENEFLADPMHPDLINQTSSNLQNVMAPNPQFPLSNSEPVLLLKKAIFQLQCLNPFQSLSILKKIENYFVEQEMFEELVMSQLAKITCQVFIDLNLTKYLKQYLKLKEAAKQHWIQLENIDNKHELLYQFAQTAFKYILQHVIRKINPGINSNQNRKIQDIQQINVQSFSLSWLEDCHYYNYWKIRIQIKYEYYLNQQQKANKKPQKSKSHVNYRTSQVILQKVLTGTFNAQNLHLGYVSLLQFLQSNRSFQQLNSLVLQDCTAFEKGFALLPQKRFSKLNRIQIYASDMSITSCQNLSKSHLPVLTTLVLRMFQSIQGVNSITCECVKFLTVWPTLVDLSLAGNLIGNKGCIYFARGKWPNLSNLRLNDNQITDDGIRHLIKADLPNLQSLSLFEDLISQRGMALITKAHWPRLKEFNIFFCYNRAQYLWKKIVVGEWTRQTIMKAHTYYYSMPKHLAAIVQNARQERE